MSTWGSGLASVAHDEVLEHLRSQCHQSAWLRVFDDNRRAVRFYERRGWRATDDLADELYPVPVLRCFEMTPADAKA